MMLSCVYMTCVHVKHVKHVNTANFTLKKTVEVKLTNLTKNNFKKI